MASIALEGLEDDDSESENTHYIPSPDSPNTEKSRKIALANALSSTVNDMKERLRKLGFTDETEIEEIAQAHKKVERADMRKRMKRIDERGLSNEIEGLNSLGSLNFSSNSSYDSDDDRTAKKSRRGGSRRRSNKKKSKRRGSSRRRGSRRRSSRRC
jgi:hypothetical protein